jgi:hypothetical protein
MKGGGYGLVGNIIGGVVDPQSVFVFTGTAKLFTPR